MPCMQFTVSHIFEYFFTFQMTSNKFQMEERKISNTTNSDSTDCIDNLKAENYVNREGH